MKKEINQSLTEVVFEKLKHDIITIYYLPGARLNIEQLKKRYVMGATPVREALNRLQPVGFVESMPLKGFKVAEVSLAHFKDLVNTRRLIESNLFAQAILQGSDQWESQIVASHHLLLKCQQQEHFIDNPDIDLWMHRFKELYRSLLSSCQSDCQLEMHYQLWDMTTRYKYLLITQVASFKAYWQPLDGLISTLIRAVLAYNCDQAVAYMNLILDHSQAMVLSYWEQIAANLQ